MAYTNKIKWSKWGNLYHRKAFEGQYTSSGSIPSKSVSIYISCFSSRFSYLLKEKYNF